MSHCNYSSKSIQDRGCVYYELTGKLYQQFPDDEQIVKLDDMVADWRDHPTRAKHRRVKKELIRQLGRSRDEYATQASLMEKTFWFRHADKVAPIKPYVGYAKTGFDALGNVLVSVKGGKAAGAAWGALVPWLEYGADQLFYAESVRLPEHVQGPQKNWKTVAVESTARGVAGAYLGKSPLKSGLAMAGIFGGAALFEDYLLERPLDFKEAGKHAAIAGVLGLLGHFIGGKYQKYLSKKAEREVEFSINKAQSRKGVEAAERVVLKSLRSGPKYKVTPAKIQGHEPLPADQLSQFKVKIKDGLICDAQGQPLSTVSPERSSQIFTMDQAGNIYVAPNTMSHVHLSVDRQVASAGEVVIWQGKLLRISNTSGHFQPSEEIFKQAIMELQEQGAVMAPKTVVWILNPGGKESAAPNVEIFLKNGAKPYPKPVLKRLLYGFRDYLPEHLKKAI